MDEALDSAACWTKGAAFFVAASWGYLHKDKIKSSLCTSHSGIKELPPQSSVSVTVSGKSLPALSHVIWHISEELSFQD